MGGHPARWAALASLCAAGAPQEQPQKLWPVGAVDPSVLADVKVAVEEHVGSLPQRATVKPEHLSGLRQPQRHRLDGDFEAGKGQLLDNLQQRLQPQTEEERAERELAQREHDRNALAALREHPFANTVSILRSQEDLYQSVIRDDGAWLVAFVNGERDVPALPIIDLAAKRLAGTAHVAVIDYSAADWDLRMAWGVLPSNVPQLRLFSTPGQLPTPVDGLTKDRGLHTFKGLTSAQQKLRAQIVSQQCDEELAEHETGRKGVKLRSRKRVKQKTSKTEL